MKSQAQASTSASRRASRKWPNTTGSNARASSPSSSTDDSADEDTWQVRSFSGTLAPSNRWFHTATDRQENKTYFLGGRRRDKNMTVPDFHCFDPSKKKWTDLTGKLKYRDPYDSFSARNSSSTKTPFPRLFDPALALVRLPGSGQPFLFIFSGYDEDAEAVRPALIAIDLTHTEWFHVKATGQAGPGRIDGAMVFSSAQSSLFIFGGRSELEDHAGGMATFSVLRYGEGTSGYKEWMWTITEQASPQLVGMGYNMQALSLYGGKKILLTPGRENALAYYNITPDKILFFDTSSRRFNAQTQLEKAFPLNKIVQCDIYEASAPPEASSSTNANGKRQRADSITTPCLIFVCALRDEKTQSLLKTSEDILEIWRYFLFPEDKIECLGLAHRMNHVLFSTGFTAVGSALNYPTSSSRAHEPVGPRLLLLGFKNNSPFRERPTVDNRTVSNSLLADDENSDDNGYETDDDCRDDLDPPRFWDTYSEIPL